MYTIMCMNFNKINKYVISIFVLNIIMHIRLVPPPFFIIGSDTLLMMDDILECLKYGLLNVCGPGFTDTNEREGNV